MTESFRFLLDHSQPQFHLADHQYSRSVALGMGNMRSRSPSKWDNQSMQWIESVNVLILQRTHTEALQSDCDGNHFICRHAFSSFFFFKEGVSKKNRKSFYHRHGCLIITWSWTKKRLHYSVFSGLAFLFWNAASTRVAHFNQTLTASHAQLAKTQLAHAFWHSITHLSCMEIITIMQITEAISKPPLLSFHLS